MTEPDAATPQAAPSAVDKHATSQAAPSAVEKLPAAANYAQQRVSLAEAKEIITYVMAARSLAVERVGLEEAIGRVSAADVTAPFALPNFANSAMDGYALRVTELTHQSEFPVQAKQLAAAGAITELLPGHAMQVATGAAIPSGASAVVIQEHVALFEAGTKAMIRVLQAPKSGEFIRARGHDFAADAKIVSIGQKLSAAEIAVLAAFNLPSVRVYCKPRVSVLVSGDELLSQGANKAQFGQIYDSNRPMLQALLHADGAQARIAPILPDNADAIEAELLRAASSSDLILAAGGASVGEKDFLPSLIQSLGTVHFYRAKIKPGMPVLFGEINGTPILCLPGNPASVFVTYLMLARDVLMHALGRRDTKLARFDVPLAVEIKKNHTRSEFVRATLRTGADGQTTVQALGGQLSSMLSTLSQADALIELPEGEGTFPAGARVKVYPLFGLL